MYIGDIDKPTWDIIMARHNLLLKISEKHGYLTVCGYHVDVRCDCIDVIKKQKMLGLLQCGGLAEKDYAPHF